jgi:hypothetical protein
VLLQQIDVGVRGACPSLFLLQCRLLLPEKEEPSLTKPINTMETPKRRPPRRGRSKSLDENALVVAMQRDASSSIDFESKHMLKERSSLRRDPRVLAALLQWWDAVDANKNGSIEREEYIDLMKAIYRVKVSDDEEDALDCQLCAEEDATSDFAGVDEIGRERFYDGIFELTEFAAALNIGHIAKNPAARC